MLYKIKSGWVLSVIVIHGASCSGRLNCATRLIVGLGKRIVCEGVESGREMNKGDRVRPVVLSGREGATKQTKPGLLHSG